MTAIVWGLVISFQRYARVSSAGLDLMTVRKGRAVGNIRSLLANWKTEDALRQSLAGGATGAVVAVATVWVIEAHKGFAALIINSDVAGAAIGVMLSVGTTVWITSRRDANEWKQAIEQSLIHIRAMLDAIEMATSITPDTAREINDQLNAAAQRLVAATSDDSITDTFLRTANSRALNRYFWFKKELHWGIGILRGTHQPHPDIPPLSTVLSTIHTELQQIANEYRGRRR